MDLELCVALVSSEEEHVAFPLPPLRTASFTEAERAARKVEVSRPSRPVYSTQAVTGVAASISSHLTDRLE